MDWCAVRSFSLLNDHNPAFLPNILAWMSYYSLASAICVVFNIQKYLHNRDMACSTTMTSFEDLIKGCFADR